LNKCKKKERGNALKTPVLERKFFHAPQYGCSVIPTRWILFVNLDYFITSLRDEVLILKELPPRDKRTMELGMICTIPPVSWYNMSYYQNQNSDKNIKC
jgi:hypothetical protein